MGIFVLKGEGFKSIYIGSGDLVCGKLPKEEVKCAIDADAVDEAV